MLRKQTHIVSFHLSNHVLYLVPASRTSYLVSMLVMPRHVVLLRRRIHQHFAFTFLEHL